jgi:hypothetical protein
LVIPLFGGFALLHAYWKAPDALRQFVGTGKGWRVNALLGAALGGALGFHFLLTASFLRGVETYRPVVWPYLLWTLCYQAGLRALGEELLFRGVAFSLLFDEARWGFVRGVTHIAVLDLIAYASFVAQVQNLPLGVLLLVYRVALIFLNVFLRSRQNSLIPGWASNVIFGVAAAVVMQ